MTCPCAALVASNSKEEIKSKVKYLQKISNLLLPDLLGQGGFGGSLFFHI